MTLLLSTLSWNQYRWPTWAKYLLDIVSSRNTQPPTSYHGENAGDISALQEGHYDAVKVSRSLLFAVMCVRAQRRAGTWIGYIRFPTPNHAITITEDV